MKKTKKDEIPPKEKTVVMPEQLIELLQNSDSIYVAIIQGASGSGKTRLLLQIAKKFKAVIKLSEDELNWRLVDAIRRNKKDEFVNYINFLSQYKITEIEDVDFLKGKPATQQIFAQLINKLLLSGTHVLITGIELEEKVPFLLSGIEKGQLVWIYM